MKIKTPAGETFRVHRRWLPWRRRMHDVDGASYVPDIDVGDDPISLVILAILLIPLLATLAIFVGELLLLLLLLPFFVLARSVFGTPWIIEVTHQRKVVHAEQARGWGASHDQIVRLAAAIRAGELPPGVLEQVNQKAKEKTQKNPRTKVRPKVSPKPETETSPGVQDTPRP